MLTEQRFDIILKLLEEKRSVTVTELRELLDASESTGRRDITALVTKAALIPARYSSIRPVVVPASR